LQIAAEWLHIAQRSQWKAYRKRSDYTHGRPCTCYRILYAHGRPTTHAHTANEKRNVLTDYQRGMVDPPQSRSVPRLPQTQSFRPTFWDVPPTSAMGRSAPTPHRSKYKLHCCVTGCWTHENTVQQSVARNDKRAFVVPIQAIKYISGTLSAAVAFQLTKCLNFSCLLPEKNSKIPEFIMLFTRKINENCQISRFSEICTNFTN